MFLRRPAPRRRCSQIAVVRISLNCFNCFLRLTPSPSRVVCLRSAWVPHVPRPWCAWVQPMMLLSVSTLREWALITLQYHYLSCKNKLNYFVMQCKNNTQYHSRISVTLLFLTNSQTNLFYTSGTHSKNIQWCKSHTHMYWVIHAIVKLSKILILPIKTYKKKL